MTMDMKAHAFCYEMHFQDCHSLKKKDVMI